MSSPSGYSGSPKHVLPIESDVLYLESAMLTMKGLVFLSMVHSHTQVARSKEFARTTTKKLILIKDFPDIC